MSVRPRAMDCLGVPLGVKRVASPKRARRALDARVRPTVNTWQYVWRAVHALPGRGPFEF
jgi:hypothetical protein